MSEYPRMLYHRDGRTAVADSAHHERTEFGGGDWSQSASDIHLREPASGSWNMAGPKEPRVERDPAAPAFQPGPVDAGTVDGIVRRALDEHPGLDAEKIAQSVFERVKAHLSPLYEALGVDPGAEPKSDKPEDTDEATKPRRGRPPGSSNKLTGASGDNQE